MNNIQNDNDNDNKSLSYKIGEMIAVALAACALTFIVALTVKCVFWLF